MTEPTIAWNDNTEFNLKRHYFFDIGLLLSDKSYLSLNPSIYLKSDGATSQLDINSNVIYNDSFGVELVID